MDAADKFSDEAEPVKNDDLKQPVFDSEPFLGLDIWEEASACLDASVETAAKGNRLLEQQQYVSDLAIDRHLHKTLEREFVLLDLWLRNNRRHSESTRVAAFLRRREQFAPLSWVERQEPFYLWALKHEADDLACSILGWRLLCRDLADSLIEWALDREQDLRSEIINQLWHGSPGYYPQNRLRIWAVRFLEDSRAPQVLVWENAINEVLLNTHPELVSAGQ